MQSLQQQQQQPFQGLLPKTSTQALDFVKSNPEYDGRGIVIGIFDTGVDPGAIGLSKCPDGSPKILDLHDCTGAGDVSMKEKRVASTTDLDLDTGKEYIIGLTGKKLLLNSNWPNPTKEFRVGIKAMYEIFPEPLVQRMKQEKKILWEKEQNACEVLASRAAAAVATNEDSKKLKKELDERVAQLKAARDGYNDSGPVVDIISFIDEEGLWRVVIDTDQSGDLSKVESPLTSYRAEHRFGTWDAKTQLNYALNIYENGDIVSIVVDSGSHGTHVAGIAAGYHGADHPELNGVAPGAQIISFKIGDTRLGGMETGTGIIRGLTAAAAAGVDIINMSFGEPSKSGGAGRVVELCRQLVLKHHIIFVSSAGNSGPALSTAGSPGGTTPHIIGVGAYVDSEMMTAEYAMRQGETPSATQYTWSSRGPTFDGQLGVSISAPGGAIACVPTWTLSGKQLMNGTSMSSPNAAGCIALILSALKAQGLPRSPSRIRRALENTAADIPTVEAFAQGHGLVQVQAAYECARTGSDTECWYLDIPFDVRVASRPAFTNSQTAHGIYLREPADTNLAQEHTIEITPVFATDADDPDVGFRVTDRTTKAQQIQFEIRVQLEISLGGARWVRTPSVILVNSKASSFKVFIDPTILPKGTANFCEILGYDQMKGKSVGALFRVPITVIRPEVVIDLQTNPSFRTVSASPLLYDPVARFSGMKLEPGLVERKFFQIPSGATWCDIRVVNETFNPEDRMFVLHCLQIRPHSRFRDDELEVFARLGGDVGSSINRALRVYGGGTLEVCLAPYWSSLGVFQISLELQFGGITANPSVAYIGPQNGYIAQIGLRSDLKDVRVEPSGEFTKWTSPLAPNKSKTKLEARFPESRNAYLAAYPPDTRPTWELRLWYDIDNKDKCKFTPKLPLKINDFLYENPLESQLTLVFDSKKKLLACMDYGHTQKQVDLEKGSYNVIVIIRHEKRAILERLKDLNLMCERTLTSNVSCQVYSLPTGPSGNAFKFEPKILKRGYETNVYLTCGTGQDGAEFFKKLPSQCKPGDILIGSVQYLKKNKDQTSFGSDDVPDGYPMYLVLPAKGTGNGGGDESSTSSSPPQDKFASVQEEQWIVPMLKSRLKLLEAPSLGDEIFEKEFTETDQLIGNLQTVFVRNELTLHSRLVKMRRCLKKFRDELKRFEGSSLATAQTAATDADDDLGSTSDVGSSPEMMLTAFSTLVDMCEQVRQCVDVASLEQKKLASKVGLVDGEIQDKESASKVDSDVKTRVDALTEALLAKAHAMMDLDAVLNPSSSPSMELSSTVEEIARWVSEKSISFTQLKFRFSLRAGKSALALSLLDKLLQEEDSDIQKLPSPETKSALLDRKIMLFEELGWKHLAEAAKKQLLVDTPLNYPLF
jgi:tripeptidyl-peptidase-2